MGRGGDTVSDRPVPTTIGEWLERVAEAQAAQRHYDAARTAEEAFVAQLDRDTARAREITNLEQLLAAVPIEGDAP